MASVKQISDVRLAFINRRGKDTVLSTAEVALIIDVLTHAGVYDSDAVQLAMMALDKERRTAKGDEAPPVGVPYSQVVRSVAEFIVQMPVAMKTAQATAHITAGEIKLRRDFSQMGIGQFIDWSK